MTKDDFKNDLDNLESLEDFSFDDDFDFSYDGDDVDLDNEDMEGRNPIVQTVRKPVKYAKEDLLNKSIGEHAELAMEGILKDDARYAASEIKAAGNEIKDKFLSQIEPLKRDTYELLTSIESKMPKEGTIRNIFDYIKGKTKPDEEFNSYARTDEVELMMNEMESKLEQAKEQIELDKVNVANDFDYKKSSITLLDSINTNIKIQTEYSKIFNKKALELQQKQFLATRDLIGLLKANHNEDKKQREAIIKNTGLPEYVKIKTSEALGQSIKSRLASKVTDTLFQGENALKLISENIMRNVGEKLDNVSTGLTMGSMVAEQIGGADKAQRDMMIGSTLSNFLLKMGYTGVGKALGYKRTNKIENFIQSLATDPSSVIRNSITDNPDGFFGKIKDKFLRTVLDYTKTDNKFKNIELETDGLKDQAIFDGETHRSINIIIPQLLGKIHNEVSGLRTGKFNIDNELRFDHDDLTFKSKKDIKEKIRGTLKSEIDDRTDQSIKDLTYLIEDKLKPVNFKGKEKLIEELPSALLAYLSEYGKLSPYDLNKKEFLQYFDPKEQNLVAQTFTIFQKLLEQDPERARILRNFSDSINTIKTSPAQLNKYSSGMNADLLVEDEYYSVDKYSGRVNADTAALRSKMKKRSGRKEYQVDKSLDSFNKYDTEKNEITFFGGEDMFGETKESDITKDFNKLKNYVKNGFKSEDKEKSIFDQETDQRGNIVTNLNGIDFVINTGKFHSLNTNKDESLNYSFVSDIIYNYELEELFKKYQEEKNPEKKEEYFIELKTKIGEIERKNILESNKHGVKGFLIKNRNKFISTFGDKEYKENSKLDYYMSEIKKGKTLKEIFNTGELSNIDTLKEYGVIKGEEFNSYKKEYTKPEEPKQELKKTINKSKSKKKKRKNKNKTKTVSSTSDDEPSGEEFNTAINNKQDIAQDILASTEKVNTKEANNVKQDNTLAEVLNKVKESETYNTIKNSKIYKDIEKQKEELKESFNTQKDKAKNKYNEYKQDPSKIKEDISNQSEEIFNTLKTKSEEIKKEYIDNKDEKIKDIKENITEIKNTLKDKLLKDTKKIEKSESVTKYLGIISEDEIDKRFSKSNAEKIKKALNASPKEIKEFIKKKYKEEITNASDYSNAKLLYLEEKLKDIKETPIEEHKKNIKEEFNSLKEKGSKKIEELKEKYFKKSTPEKEQVQAGEEILNDRFTKIKEDISNQSEEIFNTLKTKSEEIKKFNKDDLEQRVKDIKDTFNKTKDDISDTIKDSVNGLKGKFIDEYVEEISEITKKKEKEEDKKDKADNPEGVVGKVFSLREKIKYMLDPANIVKHSIKGLIKLPMHYKNFFFSDFAKNMRARERKMLKTLFTKVPLGIGRFGLKLGKGAGEGVIEGIKSYKDFFTSDTAKKVRKAEREGIVEGAKTTAGLAGKAIKQTGVGLASGIPLLGKLTSPFKWARNKFKKGKVDDNTETEQPSEENTNDENSNKNKTISKKLSKRQAKKQKVKQEKKSVVQAANEKRRKVKVAEAEKAEEREKQKEKEEQQKNSWRNRLKQLDEEKQAKAAKQQDHVKANPKESLLSKLGKMLITGFPLLLAGVKKLFSPLASIVKPILNIGKTFLGVLWKPIKWLSGMVGLGLKSLGGKIFNGLLNLGSSLIKFIPSLISGASNIGGELINGAKSVDNWLGKIPKVGKALQWGGRLIAGGAAALGIYKGAEWLFGKDDKKEEQNYINGQIVKKKTEEYKTKDISKDVYLNKDGELEVNGGTFNKVDPNKKISMDFEGEHYDNINTQEYRDKRERRSFAYAMAKAFIYAREAEKDLANLKAQGHIPTKNEKLIEKQNFKNIETVADEVFYNTEEYTIEVIKTETVKYLQRKEKAENEIRKILGQKVNNIDKKYKDDIKNKPKEEFNTEVKEDNLNVQNASMGGAAMVLGGSMMLKNTLSNQNVTDTSNGGNSLFNYLGEKAKGLWNKGKEVVSNTLNTAKTAVKDTINVAQEGVKSKGLWGGLVDGAKAWGNKIVDGAKFVGNKAVEYGTKYVNTVKEVGSKALNVASHLVPGFIKNTAKKILGVLKTFKGQILKRLGPKAALKILGTVGVKIASRLSPLGWGLLLYDAYSVWDYWHNKKLPLESAASLAILGFDLFNNDSVIRDEEGNPVKPDDPGMMDDPKAMEEFLKQSAEYEKASEEELRKEQEKLNKKYGAPELDGEEFNTYEDRSENTKQAQNTIEVGSLDNYFNQGKKFNNQNVNVKSDGSSEFEESISDSMSVAPASINFEEVKSEGIDNGQLNNLDYIKQYFDFSTPSDANLFKRTSGMTHEQAFLKLNPRFKSQLVGFAQDMISLTGVKPLINSSFRTGEYQAYLKKKMPNKAAAVGASQHQYTIAVDISSNQGSKYGKAFEQAAKAGLLEKWGLYRPYWGKYWQEKAAIRARQGRKEPPKESWHVEPLWNRAQVKTPFGYKAPLYSVLGKSLWDKLKLTTGTVGKAIEDLFAGRSKDNYGGKTNVASNTNKTMPASVYKDLDISNPKTDESFNTAPNPDSSVELALNLPPKKDLTNTKQEVKSELTEAADQSIEVAQEDKSNLNTKPDISNTAKLSNVKLDRTEVASIDTNSIYAPKIKIVTEDNKEQNKDIDKSEDITNKNILQTQISSLDLDNKQLETQTDILEELKKISEGISKLQPIPVDERIATRIQNQREEKTNSNNTTKELEKVSKSDIDRTINRPLPGFNLKRNV